MKFQKTLKPIALAMLVIGVAVSSFAHSTPKKMLTFCTISANDAHSTMLLNPTPLQRGEKCRSGNSIDATSLENAKEQVNRDNRGSVTADCKQFAQQCMAILKNHSNTTPNFNNKLCTLQENACMQPRNKGLKAEFRQQLRTIDPNVADMLLNMRPE